MLSENIKTLRKAKGLSQEELAVKLNVVRQTVSKWESGRSVPDADLLVALSEALETPTGTLLGETVAEETPDELRVIAEKLEVINTQLARRQRSARAAVRGVLIAICVLTVLGFVLLFALGSPYLGWDYGDPEQAVLGAAFHVFEWGFVRLAPLVLIAAVLALILTRRKRG